MDATWTNLLSGFIGAAVGGVLALLGSVKATKDQAAHERRMEDDRELRLHRTAVRAVVVELTSNSLALSAVPSGGMSDEFGAVDTSAYDALLVPLYSHLSPAALAPVARAYSRLHIFKDKPIVIATRHQLAIDEGLNARLRYALDDLGVDLSLPDDAKRT